MLISPVAGNLIPTYKSSNPEWAPFMEGVLFRTRHGAQVVSPLSGKIVFAGEYTKGQGKMVIIETQNSHVAISGLGSLNCQLGQNIIAGAPIGRMPTKTKTSGQSAQQLYLEVWHHEQTIDPRTVLKIKEKVLTN
jgi:septal ring factor EnvC (AmiA/AmiB activator)